MIGIEINHNSGYEHVLWDLLQDIELNNYSLNITEQEILSKDANGYILWDSTNFLTKIKESYYIIFLNLQLFSKNSQITVINTYEDFLNSACQMLLLISDHNLIEIYFKDENIKHIILQNLKNKNIHYDIKTKENDSRQIMYLN